MKFWQWLCFAVLWVVILVACKPIGSLPLLNSNIETEIPDNIVCSYSVGLDVTGGFAGVRRGIQVSSTGEAILLDEKKNEQIELLIPQVELEKLSMLMKDIGTLRKIPRSFSCVDCFHYEVDIIVCDLHSHASYDDENLDRSGIKPLIFELVLIMNNAFDK